MLIYLLIRRFSIPLVCAFAGLILFGGCRPSSPESTEDKPYLDSLLRKGIAESQALEFEKAHRTLSLLLTTAEESDDKKYRILGNLNMGAMYVYLNRYDEALKYFFKSLEIAEQEGRNEYLNSIYNNIGIIYSENEAEEKAEEYFRLALNISRERGETKRVGMNLINLGITSDRLGRDAEAIGYFREAAEIFTAFGDSVNLGAAYNSIGSVYFDKDEFREALEMFKSAYNLSSAESQPWFRWEYSLNVGRGYSALGAEDSARVYLNRAIEGFSSNQNKSMLARSFHALGDLEADNGNESLALIHYEKVLALKDSLLEEKTSKWVSELQINYALGKKEQELAMVREIREKERFIWTGGLFAALAIAVLLFSTMRTNLRNLKQKNVILEQSRTVDQLTIEKNRALSESLKRELKVSEEINALGKQKLQQEIEFRDRELAGKAIHLVNKNEVFAGINEKLKNWSEKSEDEREEDIRQILNLIKSTEKLDRDWETFKLHFEEVHPHFFSGLSAKSEILTSGDLRMAAYLMLNLSGKEISRILNISPEAVRKRKQRLREKLGLSANTDLYEWVRIQNK